jgi:two-component system nitrogen regulation response regulator NtrX
LIEINCAAIPEDLIESELFGHEKGAFTGAAQLRRGKFDLADGGTLFLDEIGDMSLKTQAKVLRILQEQKFERVGGSQTLSVDVRVIAATNKDLRAEIAAGRFREDLFYRLNVISIHLAPLRDRKEDIPVLADYFLKEFSVIHGRSGRALSEEAQNVLLAYPWPGNVRELRNTMERLVILSSDQLDPWGAAELLGHLQSDSGWSVLVRGLCREDGEGGSLSPAVPQVGDPMGGGRPLRDARHEFERNYILSTLRGNDWNISKTAQILGIERTHLHRKIKSFGIEAE